MTRSGRTSHSGGEKLSVAHLNINSLRNKIHDIQHILSNNQVHVLGLSETHLDSTVKDSRVSIEGYRLYRKDRDRHGGGVALYVQQNIPAVSRSDLMPSDVEMIWVQMFPPDSRPLLVGCCYRPPRSKQKYLDQVFEVMRRVSNEDKDVVLMGDFNVDWLSNSALKRRMASVSSECGCTQVMSLPTRLNSCIDHIYTNIPDLCSDPTSTVTGCSDHHLVTVSVRGGRHDGTNGTWHISRRAPRLQMSLSTYIQPIRFQQHPGRPLMFSLTTSFPVFERQSVTFQVAQSKAARARIGVVRRRRPQPSAELRFLSTLLVLMRKAVL